MARSVEEFGPYVVYELLGQGGMATVHRAEKRGVGIRRPIALKRLLAHAAADPELVKLFVDEARLASYLHHANVAQTYDLGRVGDTYFIAMEYASGPTLSQIVRQCLNTSSAIPIEIAVDIIAQICDALDYAHNLCDVAGHPLCIIHRDVSPGNVIVTNTGVVKLIDFGIAKATTSSVQTQAGFIKGKFGYIAPEYITGHIDARVDLFAAGVIAHELLAGRRLFEGDDDFATLRNIREMTIRPPSQWNHRVPADLDDIVMTALARDPAKRWQSAGAMRIALGNVARTLGAAVGGAQLVEWVEWAFTQLPPDSHAPSADRGFDPSNQPPHEPLRAPSPSDLDETVPLDRVRIEFNATPASEPVMPAILRSTQAVHPRVTRRHAAVAPRPSQTIQSVAPPPRASRTIEAAEPDRRPASPRLDGDAQPRTARAQGSAVEPRTSRAQGSVPPEPRSSRAHDAAAPPRGSRAHDAVAPESPTRPSRSMAAVAPAPSRPSQARPIEAAPPAQPQLPAMRPARTLDTVTPVVPSREIDVIVVPPGGMFSEPAVDAGATVEPGAPPSPPVRKLKPRGPRRTGSPTQQPPASAMLQPVAPSSPLLAAPARLAAAAAAQAAQAPFAATPARLPPAPTSHAASRRTRRVLWLVLLMIALGVAGAAAAYYWPAGL